MRFSGTVLSRNHAVHDNGSQGNIQFPPHWEDYIGLCTFLLPFRSYAYSETFGAFLIVWISIAPASVVAISSRDLLSLPHGKPSPITGDAIGARLAPSLSDLARETNIGALGWRCVN